MYTSDINPSDDIAVFQFNHNITMRVVNCYWWHQFEWFVIELWDGKMTSNDILEIIWDKLDSTISFRRLKEWKHWEVYWDDFIYHTVTYA